MLTDGVTAVPGACQGSFVKASVFLRPAKRRRVKVTVLSPRSVARLPPRRRAFMLAASTVAA